MWIINGKSGSKNVKITVPSSERYGSSLSSMSKHSHDTYSVPKNKSKTIPGPLFKGHEVTQEETDLDKDKKLSVGLKEQDWQQCV